jgi:predicted ABC-type ATPase
MRKNKPVLIVVAGPNGSGKTTITERLLTHSWTDNAACINPDIIAQEQFGGWNNKEAVLKAAAIINRLTVSTFNLLCWYSMPTF